MVASLTRMVVARLPEIERVAWLCTPDWDDWCGNASDRVSAYLAREGIGHTVEDISDWAPNWPYGSHTFIRLSDGAILDVTITQYVGEGHPVLRGGLSTSRTAVFPRGHPRYRMYRGSRPARPTPTRRLVSGQVRVRQSRRRT